MAEPQIKYFRFLDGLSTGAFYALLTWTALATNRYGWAPYIAQLLLIAALLGWLAHMVAERRLEWRRSALDVPLALFVAYVVVQYLIGNRPLVEWALAPPPPTPELMATLPGPFFLVGTVAPSETWPAMLLLCLYAGTYFFVVNRIRTRRELDRCVRYVLLLGGLLAFLGLVDYLAGDAWLLWSPTPWGGRLKATFGNPDHFATWLAMLVALGVGFLAARSRRDRGTASLAVILGDRRAREEAVRRYLPLVAVVVMAVALVLTLSRGAVLALLVGVVVLFSMFWGSGRMRWGAVVLGSVVAITLGYVSWIGIGPLLARFEEVAGGAADRWSIYVASLPMLRDFPLFGVGLGAYPQAYFRHQTLAQRPDELFYNAAHSEVLQLVLETGFLGTALALFLASRAVRDLVGAHLLGRSRCPAGGGTGDIAQRSDRYNVGIALGALGGLATLLVHSAVEFPMRTPANAVLAATLLGLATVALHTRFHHGEARLLVEIRSLTLAGRGRFPAIAAAVLVLLLLGGWTKTAIQSARVSTVIDQVRRNSKLSAEPAFEIDPTNPWGLRARAHRKQQEAVAIWAGLLAPSRPGQWREGAIDRLAEARTHLRAAITALPMDPWLQQRLASVELGVPVISGRPEEPRLTVALAHAARSLALAPENATHYLATAQMAVKRADIGVRAAHEAAKRQPDLLTRLVSTYVEADLTTAQWLAMAGDSPALLWRLARLLEEAKVPSASLAAYRRAVETATVEHKPLLRWALAQALDRMGEQQAALAQLSEALTEAPANPELHLAAAHILERQGVPDALDRFRLAVTLAEQQARASARPPLLPFAVDDITLVPLVRATMPARVDDQPLVLRYQRALARYLVARQLWPQAVTTWRDIIREHPDDASAHHALAVALEGIQESREALEHYRRAVELDGSTPDYRKRLAARLWRDEQYFQAINEWRTVKAQLVDDVEPRLALAEAYERVGEPVAAFREYVDILRVLPGQTTAEKALSRLRAGRKFP